MATTQIRVDSQAWGEIKNLIKENYLQGSFKKFANLSNVNISLFLLRVLIEHIKRESSSKEKEIKVSFTKEF